jgi:nuclear cap-binding protein subunit 1
MGLETPYAPEGREILSLLRKRAPDEEVQEVINAIHVQAAEHGITDVLIPSTDAYVTSICYIGSKSLSHVLSCIERCKERLLSVGPASEAARRQIIESVVSYWRDQPGIAVNIVDKLLNYTILTPLSVIEWALNAERLGSCKELASPYLFEMVDGTVSKVTNRVRQILAARLDATATLPADQLAMVDETLAREREAMRSLLKTIEDAVSGVAAGAADGFMEADGGPELPNEDDAVLVKKWGERWARVFRRKAAVEEAIVGAEAVAGAIAASERKAAQQKEEAAAKEKAEREAAEAAEAAAAEAAGAAEEAAPATENGTEAAGNGADYMEEDVADAV